MNVRISNCVFVIFILLIYSNCSAKGDSETAMPRIVEWVDGKGIDAEGNRIVDAWAYDTCNPAGKYVLFGADGSVLRRQEKAESSESDIAENYSVTDINPGRFLLRADVFSGFRGTVDVTIREKSGRKISAVLEEAGFYDGTIFATAGSYQILAVKATDGECSYQVIYPEKTYEITDEKPIIIRMQVLDQRKDICTTLETAQNEDTPAIAEVYKRQETERKESDNLKRKAGKRIIFLLSVIAGGILSIYFAFRGHKFGRRK